MKRLVLAGASLTLALAIAETVVRALGIAEAIQVPRLSDEDVAYRGSANPLLEYELKPGYVTSNADFRQSYPAINSAGLRDIERAVPKPAGVKRVLVLGDEVVEGRGIRRLDDTLSRQWEKLNSDPSTEVLNFGVGGYCTLAKVELLETEGLRFQPNVVVLVFTDDDYRNFNQPPAWVSPAADRSALAGVLFRFSHVFRLACVRLDLLGVAAEADPLGWNHRAIGSNNVPDGLRRLKALAGREGFDLLIAVWPRFTEDGVEDPQRLTDGGNELVIERLAKSLGVATVRLSEAFRADWQSVGRQSSPRLRYSQGDGRLPSPEGCRISAATLNGLLESRDSDSALTKRDQNSAPASEPDAVAVQAARRLGSEEPNNSRIFDNIGNRLAAVQQYDEAARFFRLALDEDSRFAAARDHWGTVLELQGRMREALDQYQHALELQPDLAEVHYHLGKLYWQQRQFQRAIEHLGRAVECEPGFVAARVELGTFLAAGGMLDEAAAQYRLALRHEPDSKSAHYNLGVVYEKQGDSAQAARQYERVLRIDPNFAPGHYSIGVLRKQQGYLLQAAESYRQALAIQPDYAPAHVNLGGVLQDQGRMSQAAEHYRRALGIDPDSADAHYNLGVVLAEQGEYGQAIAEFERVLRLEPGHGDAAKNLNLARRKMISDAPRE